MADQVAIVVEVPQVESGSSITATAYFRNRATSAASTPSSVRYRVDCLTTARNVINWTSAPPAGSVAFEIPGTLNGIVDDGNNVETRQITVEIDSGSSTQVRSAATWRVKNIRLYEPMANFDDDLQIEPYYPINGAETTEGLIESDLATNYYYGDVRRYRGLEGADITTALQTAIDVSDTVLVPFTSCSAGNVAFRSGVSVKGLGKYATTVTRVGTNPIFTNLAATERCSLSEMTLSANSSYTNPVCSFEAGSSYFRVSRLRFTNFDSGSSACAGLYWDLDSSASNHDIAIDDCEFDNSTGTSTSNYNSILVYNPRALRVTKCLLMNAGSITTATATSFVGATGDVYIEDNVLRGVDSSVILLRVNGGALMENVHVSRNSFYDCSPTLGKWCVTIQQAPATTGGAFRNININDNAARCRDVDCDGFAVVSTTGAAAVNGVTVTGNSVDFTDSSGNAHTTGNADQRGIWVFGDATNLATNVTISGNSIRGSQSFGIGISSALGWSIVGNSLTLCVTNSASGGVAIESGIFIPQGTTRQGTIVGNTVVNSGGGGATQSGIGSASSATISHAFVGGNSCIDNRGGSAAMVYGFNFGAAATDIWWARNQSIGHTSAVVNPASPGVVAYTVTNHTQDRTFDANASSTAELADLVGTMLLDETAGRFITAAIS